MKLLSKLFLVHWHSYEVEEIEFEQTTFLTGKTGTGKSTVIDAMQFVLLGDRRARYFNKAANEKSDRTLKHYLYGLTNVTKKKETYLRDGKTFTSYVLAQFQDTVNNQAFTVGAVFDCPESKEYTFRYVIYDGPIDKEQIIQNNKSLSMEDFIGYIRRNFVFKTTDSDTLYRKYFKEKMGHISDKYFDLFRTAVPFSPFMDIEDFISQFVGGDNIIDLDIMKDNIRNYKLLQKEMLKTKEQIKYLEVVNKKYDEFKNANDSYFFDKFVVERAAVGEIEEDIDNKTFSKKNEQITVKNAENKCLAVEKNMAELREARTRIAAELQTQGKDTLDKLSSKLTEIEQKIKQSNIAKNRAGDLFNILLNSDWEAISGLTREADIDPLLSKQVNEFEKLVASFPWEIPKGKLVEINNLRHRSHDAAQNEFYSLTRQIETLEKENQSLTDKINDLKIGKRSYRNPKLVEFRNCLSRILSEKHGKGIEVGILCELIDVKDERWRKAIEGYLNSQRFYLIIDPQYYDEASLIYDEMKNTYFGIGIVDIGSIMKHQGLRQVLTNSLAEEVLTENQFARIYVDYILGRLIKCERVQELKQHGSAITDGCVLYHNFVLRALNPELHNPPFIGTRSLHEQIANNERLLEENEKVITSASEKKNRLKNILNVVRVLHSQDIDLLYGKPGETGIMEESNQLPDLFMEEKELNKKLESFDLLFITTLEGQIEKIDLKLDELLNQLDEQRTIKQVSSRLIPQLSKDIEELFLKRNREYGLLEENYTGWVKFKEAENVYHQEKEKMYSAYKVKEKYIRIVKSKETYKGELQEALDESRQEFLHHSSAKLNIQEKTNDGWSREYNRLVQTQLPEFEDQIEEARKRAEIQFQEDFISKLRAQIEETNDQIIALNDALRSQFGNARYEFTVSAKQEFERYYKMIMDEMLFNGVGIFSAGFLSVHGETVKELFDQIVSTYEDDSNELSKEFEKNLKRYTDYRTYLEFDLKEMSGDEESSLAGMMSAKSGGESQTPFFITLLASFTKAYRMKLKDYNTMRLILCDEAFSKMDHTRVKDCINKAKEMGFQFVFAAPTEKIPNIVNLVDRTLVFMKIGKRQVVQPFDSLKKD